MQVTQTKTLPHLSSKGPWVSGLGSGTQVPQTRDLPQDAPDPQALWSRRKEILQFPESYSAVASSRNLSSACPRPPFQPPRVRPPARGPSAPGRQLRWARPLHARPHPGRPVRVALHLGKHQVPGLEGVWHAVGGGPGRGKQQRRRCEANPEAGVGRLRGGGVRRGRRPASTYWV